MITQLDHTQADREPLLVEDTLMLLLDPQTGSPAAAQALAAVLGGAVLSELALRGRVQTEPGAKVRASTKVLAVKGLPLADPVLAKAMAVVEQKPRAAQTIMVVIGTPLVKELPPRLAQRGFIREDSKRFLGIPYTTWPQASTAHRDGVLALLHSVVSGERPPTARSAILLSLLASSGALPRVLGLKGRQGREAVAAAKELAKGNWGAGAAQDAIEQSMAAIAAGIAGAVAATVAAGVAIAGSNG